MAAPALRNRLLELQSRTPREGWKRKPFCGVYEAKDCSKQPDGATKYPDQLTEAGWRRHAIKKIRMLMMGE